jgi:hypothetical protein
MSEEIDRELPEFQQALRKICGEHVEFRLSHCLQEIVDRCHITLANLGNRNPFRIDGTILFGALRVFMPDNSSFGSTVATAEDLVRNSNGRVCFVHCFDDRGKDRGEKPEPYIVAFAQEREAINIEHLTRLTQLKAFL